GHEVEDEPQTDEQPVDARDPVDRRPGNDVEERRPGEKQQTEERHEERIERRADLVAPDPPDRECDPWAEPEREEGEATHRSRTLLPAVDGVEGRAVGPTEQASS